MVNQKDRIVKISPAFLERLIDTVCYTAIRKTFSMVNQKDRIIKISPAFLERLIDTVCYTA